MAFAAPAVVLVAVSLGKVLSLQFLIWVLPPVALVLVSEGTGRRVVGALCLAAVALTQVEFPHHYHALVRLETAPIVIVAMRNGLLLAAAVSR